MGPGGRRPSGAGKPLRQNNYKITWNDIKRAIKKNGDSPGEILTDEDMRLRARANIESALKQTDWKNYGTGGAAELLGIKPTTLLSRIKKMGIGKSV